MRLQRLSDKLSSQIGRREIMRMEDRIKTLLEENLQPSHLEVINQSQLHAGHSGDNGTGESHFLGTIASRQFDGKGKTECHRMVYRILQEPMKAIHALEIHTIAHQ